MSRTTRVAFTVAAALGAAACADVTNSNDLSTLALEPAFQTMPLGLSAASTSFDASADLGRAFYPGALDGPGASWLNAQGHGGGPGQDARRGPRRNGFGGPGIRGLLMGGGLGPDFLGLIKYGKALGRGPFFPFPMPDTCTFDSTAGRVTCPDMVHGTITVTKSFQFKDTAGAIQSAFDTASTNLVNVLTTVTGTKVRRDSSTSTVDHASDRTVSGLAPGSTERTVNGTAHASEVTTGVRDSVAFTATRVATDSVRSLVIPIADGGPTIPSSGVIVRAMTVTIAPAGGDSVTRYRREQLTFDGTNVVQVVVTSGGVTTNCTITLPSKRLVCE